MLNSANNNNGRTDKKKESSSSNTSATNDIKTIKKGELPKNAQKGLAEWEKNGFKEGTRRNVKGGGKWDNKNGDLPTNTTYKEYDLGPKTGKTRGPERFVRGEDGSLYYTNNHYGQVNNGQPAFYKLK